MRRFALAAILVTACAPEIPNGVYVCTVDAECPPGMGCDAAGRCTTSAGCTPQSCEDLRADCGFIDDGCGVQMDCGRTCPGTQGCGAGGIPNICACQPAQCVPGVSCGTISDGCGENIDCGDCFVGSQCVGGTCTCDLGVICGPNNCGPIADGCGGFIDCGMCPPATPNCGGDGEPNVCGSGMCDPIDCTATQCGPLPDGCGGIVDCGMCANPADSCGALVPNECGCVSLTCDQLGFKCGEAIDPCTGAALVCGGCAEGTTCGGGGIPNECGCPPPGCDGRCGVLDDPCAMMETDCGACPSTQMCAANVCRCTADSAEDNDTAMDARGMGDLVSGARQAHSFNIDGPRDDDYYYWSLGGAGTLSSTFNFRLDLRNVPADADFDIELRPICFVPMAQRVECIAPAVPIGTHPGCRAPADGNETIQMRVTGCPLTGVLVGVKPVLFGDTCSDYELELRVDVTAAPALP